MFREQQNFAGITGDTHPWSKTVFMKHSHTATLTDGPELTGSGG